MLTFRSSILDYLSEMQISPYLLIFNFEFLLATQGALLKLCVRKLGVSVC